jgi:uncharacterized protein (TIGR02594 family)
MAVPHVVGAFKTRGDRKAEQEGKTPPPPTTGGNGTSNKPHGQSKGQSNSAPSGQSRRRNQRTLLEIAKGELGTKEIPGPQSNPRILQYAKDQGIKGYTNDDTAWCALFAGWVIHKAGYKPTGSLRAKSYLEWGVPATIADVPSGNVVAVFHRGKPGAPTGHVGIVSRMTDKSLYLVGGNQSNNVTEALYKQDKLLALRKPE